MLAAEAAEASFERDFPGNCPAGAAKADTLPVQEVGRGPTTCDRSWRFARKAQ